MVQKSTRSLHAQASNHDPDSGLSNSSATCDQYARKYDSSPYFATHSLGSTDQAFDHSKPADHDSDVEVETGIRIRKRQARNQASPENLSTQGTASRRLRLLMDNPQECSDEFIITNYKEVESIISEVRVTNY